MGENQIQAIFLLHLQGLLPPYFVEEIMHYIWRWEEEEEGEGEGTGEVVWPIKAVTNRVCLNAAADDNFFILFVFMLL